MVVQTDHTEPCCYLTESTPVLHPADWEWVLKIVGFVHILKHVCLDARKRNRCSVFMCVWEGESGRAPVCLCVFLLMFVRKRARTWDENPSFMCACVSDLTEGWGVLYWKVLLSSPVQHAGLAPAVSHGAVPPSPPAHLHKAQTGGDVTNKPGTHSAGCLSYVNSFASFSPWQEQNTQDSSSEPTCMRAPRDKDVSWVQTLLHK